MNTPDKINKTTDYSIFKTLKGNRYVNESHYRKLLLSFKDNPLPTIIVVNEKLEVIDGQHRLKCLQELNLEVEYVVRVGFGLKECQILNINTSRWKMDDYIDGYCGLEYSSYLQTRDFKNEYGFRINETILLLSGNIGGAVKEDFINGVFKIKDFKKSKEIAEKLKNLDPYFVQGDRNRYKARNLVKTFIELEKNKDFNYEHFLNQLKKNMPYKLQTQPRKDMTEEMIENIYNYNVKIRGFKKFKF